MGFKESASFATYLSMGAVAARATALDLRDSHGHRPIELERYAMSNKIWQQKVKRLRMPDLVCVNCGLRVESRGKSKLGVILSHSDTVGREWFGGGMRPADLFAFSYVDVSSPTPITGAATYLTHDSLTQAAAHAKVGPPKSATAGSERSIEWPTYVPSMDGVLEEPPALLVAPTTPSLYIRKANGVLQTYSAWANWPTRNRYLPYGTPIVGGQTIVAGAASAATPAQTDCPGAIWDIGADLTSNDPIDRFAAVKAAGYLPAPDLMAIISGITDHPDTDWRLQMEALSTLSRLGVVEAVGRLEAVVFSDGSDDRRMEAVLILAEVDEPAATEALVAVAASLELPSEVRSAAVWGLGQGVRPEPIAVINYIGDVDDAVALHAAAAISTPDATVAAALGALLAGAPRIAEAAAIVLLRNGRIPELLAAARGVGPGQVLALRALGDIPTAAFAAVGEVGVTVEFANELRALWRGLDDWMRQGGVEELDALSLQRIRFGPEI